MPTQRLLQRHVKVEHETAPPMGPKQTADHGSVARRGEDALQHDVIAMIKTESDRLIDQRRSNTAWLVPFPQEDRAQIVLLHQRDTTPGPRPHRPRDRALPRSRVTPDHHQRCRSRPDHRTIRHRRRCCQHEPRQRANHRTKSRFSARRAPRSNTCQPESACMCSLSGKHRRAAGPGGPSWWLPEGRHCLGVRRRRSSAVLPPSQRSHHLRDSQGHGGLPGPSSPMVVSARHAGRAGEMGTVSDGIGR